MEYYSALKSRWNFASCYKMGGSGEILLSERSQKEKYRYPAILHLGEIRGNKASKETLFSHQLDRTEITGVGRTRREEAYGGVSSTF